MNVSGVQFVLTILRLYLTVLTFLETQNCEICNDYIIEYSEKNRENCENCMLPQKVTATSHNLDFSTQNSTIPSLNLQMQVNILQFRTAKKKVRIVSFKCFITFSIFSFSENKLPLKHYTGIKRLITFYSFSCFKWLTIVHDSKTNKM